MFVFPRQQASPHLRPQFRQCCRNRQGRVLLRAGQHATAPHRPVHSGSCSIPRRQEWRSSSTHGRRLLDWCAAGNGIAGSVLLPLRSLGTALHGAMLIPPRAWRAALFLGFHASTCCLWSSDLSEVLAHCGSDFYVPDESDVEWLFLCPRLLSYPPLKNACLDLPRFKLDSLLYPALYLRGS